MALSDLKQQLQQSTSLNKAKESLSLLRILHDEHFIYLAFLNDNNAHDPIYRHTYSDLYRPSGYLQKIKDTFPRLDTQVGSAIAKILHSYTPMEDNISLNTSQRKHYIQKVTALLDIIRSHKDLQCSHLEQELANCIYQSHLELNKQSIKNISRVFFHNPHQEVSVLTNRLFSGSIAIREVMKKQTKDYDDSYRLRSPIKTVIQLGKNINCELFYYEEDYYDCVNSQTKLLEIINGQVYIDPVITLWGKYHDLEKENTNTIVPKEFRDSELHILYPHHKQGRTYIGSLQKNQTGKRKLTIFNSHERLRYGAHYVKSNNNQYRECCIEDDGTIKKEIIAKNAYQGIEVEYRKNILTQL